MNKLSNISVPSVSQLTKTQIEVTASDLIESVTDGWEDALDLDLRLKFMEECVKQARAKIEPNVRAIAENMKKKFGVKISFRNGYANYDYEADRQYKYLIDKANERKEVLKNAAKSKHIIMTDDGEQILKVPVKSYVKDSVSYTFEK